MSKGTLLILAITLASAARAAQAQTPVLSSDKVCHFYGEASSGGSAFNKDESCDIPRIELLDRNFRQRDFVCCGGGANAPTTSNDIPAGLEIKVDGGYYWAAYNPKLSGSAFSMHLYCGPAGGGGPGCNVKVDVIAHYSIVPAAVNSSETPKTTPPVEQKPVATTDDKQKQKDPPSQGMGTDKLLAFIFGVVFITVLLIVAIFDRNPGPFAIFVYRVVLALAAAGIGAVIPGMIAVDINPVIRAGGAIALFIIIYWFKPADLIAQNQPPKNTPQTPA